MGRVSAFVHVAEGLLARACRVRKVGPELLDAAAAAKYEVVGRAREVLQIVGSLGGMAVDWSRLFQTEELVSLALLSDGANDVLGIRLGKSMIDGARRAQTLSKPHLPGA